MDFGIFCLSKYLCLYSIHLIKLEKEKEKNRSVAEKEADFGWD